MIRLPYCAYKRWYRRLAVFLFDLLGFVVFFPLKLLGRPMNPAALKKILVIRIDHLGDAIMTRPALMALWKSFPEIQIDVMLSKENVVLFDDAREIRNIITVTQHWFSRYTESQNWWQAALFMLSRMRKGKYDLVIDFRGDLRHILLMALSRIPLRLGFGITGGGFLLTHTAKYSPSKHQVQRNIGLLACLGIRKIPDNEPFSYSGERKRRFWNLHEEALRSPWPTRIVIHPGAGYASKRWAANKYESVIEKIIDAGLGQIVLIGTEDEKSFGPRPKPSERLVDLRGKTRISDLPILLDTSQLFIGNDSGPAHIAAMQGLDTLVIFSGTNDYRVWRPWTNRLHLIRCAVPCSPCESQFCHLRHHDCMAKIEPDRVFERVRNILAGQPPAKKQQNEFLGHEGF